MELKKCLLTKNPCYKAGTKITPTKIVVHSTAANNTTLKRYVQPDDGLLGKNKFNNHWNKSSVKKCVHAFIGTDKNKDIQVYQTLPFNFAAWGVGKGKKGSYNYYGDKGAIQFEICEDNLKNKDYFTKVFDLAAEFCAYLCKEYNIKVTDIVSHHEAHELGYGSNHSDCDHWLKKFGKDMDWFRAQVEKKIGTTVKEEPKEEPKKTEIKGTKVNYQVTITSKTLTIRTEPKSSSKKNGSAKKGEVFTIVEEYKGWGKLKSGAGWIYLQYTKKKTATKKKSVTTIAKEVIDGKWGNGATRKKKLTEAGYDASEVQAEVNKLLKK